MFSPWLLPSPVIQLLRTRTRFSGLSVLQVRGSGPRGVSGLRFLGSSVRNSARIRLFAKRGSAAHFKSFQQRSLFLEFAVWAVGFRRSGFWDLQ